MQDLVAGQIDILFDQHRISLPQATAGQIKDRKPGRSTKTSCDAWPDLTLGQKAAAGHDARQRQVLFSSGRQKSDFEKNFMSIDKMTA
jgi:hypothetical protein